MIPVSTASQVRALDERTIRGVGVPGAVLMENAGRLATAELLSTFGQAARAGVVVCCGRGNNGGDGYVIARLLHLSGVPVRVVAPAEPDTPDCALNAAICKKLGVPVGAGLDLDGAGVLVDALLGTGVFSPLRGAVADLVERMNQATADGVPVFAVDVPTGLDADTGAVLGRAVKARVTATFGRLKAGFFLEPGPDYCGRLVLCDIGLGAGEAWSGEPEGRTATGFVLQIPEASDVETWLPVRAAGGHKGSSGHLAVVAGSSERAGAAVLVSNAAIRAGAGLVTLFLPREGWARLGALRPEIMVADVSDLRPESFTALAVGPGVGLEAAVRDRCLALWQGAAIPGVFDADALTHLATALAAAPFPRLITPHPGEAGRLLGCTASEVQADRLGTVRRLSAFGTVLLKGRNTLICEQGDVEPPYVNPTGGPQLSTAGSGDVLTGICGALLAQGLTPGKAGAAAAFLHGYAAELAGAQPIVAGDVVENIPRAFSGTREEISRRGEAIGKAG